VLTGSVLAAPGAALAHQPYCESSDLKAETPWQVPDSSVSYAYFGNLYPETDVDYFTFDAAAGDEVLLSLSIPAIDGQEDFAPVMVVYGPGLDNDEQLDLPESVMIPDDMGALMVPLGDEGEYWYEPFGGRYYWNWENYFLQIPEDASYMVALWHPEGELGRYSFVVGEEEIRGGDMDCMATFDDFWTPLLAGENPYPDAVASDGDEHLDGDKHEDGAAHDHTEMIEVETDFAPFVDLQVIALDDGGYNVHVQTLNFVFTPQHVGKDAVEGEGHAHLYIDGEKVARIYGEWFYLASLPEDAEMISVSLLSNNHQPLAVEGEEIADMVIVADILSVEE
jgi:hypothetical protein